MAYLDENGDFLESDGRYNGILLEPGKSVFSTSYFFSDDFNGLMKFFGVYYEYTLSESDASGNNHYEINLQKQTSIFLIL